MPRKTGRRAAARVRLCIPAKVQFLHGLEKCLLDDLSQTGARVTIAARLPRPGVGVVLKVQGIEVFGDVMWSHGARFGIRFEQPLPLQAVIDVRHFADAYADQEAAQMRRLARSFVEGGPRVRPFS